MPEAAAPPVPDGVDPMAWLQAVAEVRAFCGWHLAPSLRETLTVDGSGSSLQLLPTLHLTELHSISSDGTDVTDPEWSDMGAVKGPRFWTAKYRGVVADITHGYDDFPLEVMAVLRSLASSGVSALGGIPTKMTSGPHSVELSNAAPLQRTILERYRVRPTP